MKMIGGQVRGRQHPSTTVASPWNQLAMFTTFTATAEGPVCVTADVLRSAVRKEIGLADTVKFDMRLMRVDAWTLPADADSINNTIVFAPGNWTNRDACAVELLKWYEAWGTAVQPAHIHYVWPVSVSNIGIPDGNSFPLYLFDARTVNASAKTFTKLLTKVHLMWRPISPDPRPTVTAILESWRSRPVQRREPSPPGVDWDDLSGVDQVTRPVASVMASMQI